MTNVTPIQQPAIEDLRNALMIAELGPDLFHHIDHEQDAGSAFGDITRLLRHALEQLGEPNLAAVQATEILVREWHGTPDEQRSARDTAAGILHAQMTGAVPPTWKVP